MAAEVPFLAAACLHPSGHLRATKMRKARLLHRYGSAICCVQICLGNVWLTGSDYNTLTSDLRKK